MIYHPDHGSKQQKPHNPSAENHNSTRTQLRTSLHKKAKKGADNRIKLFSHGKKKTDQKKKTRKRKR